jgi:putative multidrug resistance efflux transporter
MTNLVTLGIPHARHQATSAYQLAAVDATQSAEVLFSLLGEILLLQGALPGPAGAAGLALTVIGLILYVRLQAADGKS